MRRMYSEKQLQDIASKQVQEQVSSGNLQNVKIFENIIDKDGHKRFIEGTISVEEQTGLTITYGKWSLSGTHFMLVIAGSVSAGNSAYLSLTTTLNNLPSWVLAKIHPLGSGDNVAYGQIDIYTNNTGTIGHEDVILIKQSELGLYHVSAIGDADNAVAFRVAFDLLIDNE